jgi:ferredoxin
MPTFVIDKSKCRKCAKALRMAKDLIKKAPDGLYEIARQPQCEKELCAMECACENCPFRAIKKI